MPHLSHISLQPGTLAMVLSIITFKHLSNTRSFAHTRSVAHLQLRDTDRAVRALRSLGTIADQLSITMNRDNAASLIPLDTLLTLLLGGYSNRPFKTGAHTSANATASATSLRLPSARRSHTIGTECSPHRHTRLLGLGLLRVTLTVRVRVRVRVRNLL
jgi:hypothetical protein